MISSVTTIDSQSVSVTWTAPTQRNGVLISYTITYYTESDNDSDAIFIPCNGRMVRTVCVELASLLQ